MVKVALIAGITGQDGAYLAELLIRKNYEVHAIKRCSSLFNTGHIDHLHQYPHLGTSAAVNVGCGEDLTVRELAELIRGSCGLQGAADIRDIQA